MISIKSRAKLIRYHVWLGWLIGVPLLFWTVSGLFMVAQPIDTIRGEHLKNPVPALENISAVAPSLDGRPTQSLTLTQSALGPVWLITYADGGTRRADALTGALLPSVTAQDAARIADTHFAGTASLVSVKKFAADAAPLDLRRPVSSWQARYSDGTNVYVDETTGAILATRSQLWRVFDFMWGLHIMDLQEREDTSHPILILFAALALIGTVLGVVLVPLRYIKNAKSRH